VADGDDASVADLHDQVQFYVGELASVSDERDTLARDLASMTAAHDALLEARGEAEAQLVASSAAVEDMRAQMRTLVEQLSETHARRGASEHQLHETSAQLAQARAAVAAQSLELATAAAELEAAPARVARLQPDAASADRLRAALAVALEALAVLDVSSASGSVVATRVAGGSLADAVLPHMPPPQPAAEASAPTPQADGKHDGCAALPPLPDSMEMAAAARIVPSYPLLRSALTKLYPLVAEPARDGSASGGGGGGGRVPPPPPPRSHEHAGATPQLTIETLLVRADEVVRTATAVASSFDALLNDVGRRSAAATGGATPAALGASALAAIAASAGGAGAWASSSSNFRSSRVAAGGIAGLPSLFDDAALAGPLARRHVALLLLLSGIVPGGHVEGMAAAVEPVVGARAAVAYLKTLARWHPAAAPAVGMLEAALAAADAAAPTAAAEQTRGTGSAGSVSTDAMKGMLDVVRARASAAEQKHAATLGELAVAREVAAALAAAARAAQAETTDVVQRLAGARGSVQALVDRTTVRVNCRLSVTKVVVVVVAELSVVSCCCSRRFVDDVRGLLLSSVMCCRCR
jgi:hypothetical protein